MSGYEDRLFRQALDHQLAGRLTEASRLFQEILLARPDHTDALYLLGVIAYQTSRPVQAVKLLRRALAIGPEQAAPQRWVHKPIRNYCVVDLTVLLDRARVAAGFGSLRRITGSACILSRRASKILVLGRSPPSRYLVLSAASETNSQKARWVDCLS